jgi:hypothetical protein
MVGSQGQNNHCHLRFILNMVEMESSASIAAGER